MESAALPKPEAFEIPLDELRAGAPGKKLATRPKLGSTATIQVKSSEKPEDGAFDKITLAIGRKKASSLALSAKASLASRRALEVSRATKKTYELGLAETLQSILSKQRHAEVKKMEMIQAKVEKLKLHNESVSIRRSASSEELLCPGSDDILASQSAAAARRQSLLDSKLTPLRAHSALVATRRSLLPPPSPAKKTDLDAASQRRESLTSKKLEPIKKHLELVDERRRRSAASRQDSTATLELDGLETASSNKTSTVAIDSGASTSV